MNYQAAIDQIVLRYARKLKAWNKHEEKWDAYAGRVLKEMAEEISKVVRDATLRYHEAKEKGEKIPDDVTALPLFRNASQPYIPPPPPGTPDPIRG